MKNYPLLVLSWILLASSVSAWAGPIAVIQLEGISHENDPAMQSARKILARYLSDYPNDGSYRTSMRESGIYKKTWNPFNRTKLVGMLIEGRPVRDFSADRLRGELESID